MQIDPDKTVCSLCRGPPSKNCETRIIISAVNLKSFPSPPLLDWPRQSEDRREHNIMQNLLKACCSGPSVEKANLEYFS
jgi:hypothetical protein